MDNEEREELVMKTVHWISQADRAVKSVGGCGVEVILEGMSDRLLHTMIVNGIMITSRKLDNES